MARLNKSFWLGVFITSVAWTVCMFLYWTFLTDLQSEDGNGPFTNKPNAWNKLFAKEVRTIPESLIKELDPHSNIINELGLVETVEQKMIRDIGYRRHAFNVLVSDNIGKFRGIPDTRNQHCESQKYSNKLPTVSIVMCFHNEHDSTLVRSMNTVLQRTPSHILHEFILINDASDSSSLNDAVKEEIRKIGTDKIIRLHVNNQREGLIRSRVIGARLATGDVIVFLDSHIEVNTGWIEPLLDVVKKDRTALAMPIIDIINADTFAYSSSPLVRGGFNWGLHFKWDAIPSSEINGTQGVIGPFKSPTMAGGLFAVDRNYFKELGEYDMGMDIWGGENLEISFRVWQCGGSILLVPCSRVGHVFRKRRPYGSPTGEDTMTRNSLRLAYVWMDEYVKYYLNQNSQTKGVDYGDISDRIALRKNLKCKSFKWYLDTVYPEIDIPGERKKAKNSEELSKFQPWHSRSRNYVKSFQLRLSHTHLCMTIKGNAKKDGFWKRGSSLELVPCLRIASQMWYITDKNELVFGKLLCLEGADNRSGIPILNKCHEMGGGQEWKPTDDRSALIYNMATGTCLHARNAVKHTDVILDMCTKGEHKTWDIVES